MGNTYNLVINKSSTYPKINNETCLPCEKIRELLKNETNLPFQLKEIINEHCGDDKIDENNKVVLMVSNKIDGEYVNSTREYTETENGKSFGLISTIGWRVNQPNECSGKVQMQVSNKVSRIYVDDLWCVPCSAFEKISKYESNSQVHNWIKKECSS